MKKDERTEDLNPRSDDIEERVKRMLDPSMPDEPEQTKQVASPVKSKKSITIQAVSSPAEDDTLPSAPELPTDKPEPAKAPDVLPAEAKKSKKVIIPIAHHDETETPEPAVTVKAIEDTETAPLVQKITITDHADSTEEVAEKLDEAIADLDKSTDDKTIESAIQEASQEPTEDMEPIEPAVAEIPVEDPAVLVDPSTDKAVEEIIAAEGDELLEVEDAVRDTDEPVKPTKKPRKSPLQIIKTLWAKPALRWAVLIIGLVGIVTAFVAPSSRYFLLNTAGVRASSSVIVLDQSTKQPLKNVTVKVGSVTSVTNEEGEVSLKNVKLGPSELTIEKRAFAPIDKSIVVGWGSNPLGEFSLTPTGSQYSFTTVDYLSGKPIAKAEASSNEASAISDDKGNIKLTKDSVGDEPFEATIKADGFRSETVSIDPNSKTTTTIKLVPARKQVFVSKRTGTYDIYSVYIDGQEEKVLLGGSGNEKEGMVLVPHPKEDVVAYVSTRAGQQNSEGFMLSNLILIHPEDSSTTNVVVSERIQIVDWIGDRLVYVQIAAGGSANSPKRYRLMCYNYKDAKNQELASSNYFNDVIAAENTIYYAPSSAFQTGKAGLYKVQADGSNQQTLFDKEVWNIFRTSYDHLALSVQQQWYDYQLGSKAPTKLNSAPASQVPRVYINSPDVKRSAWVDNRDGKGALLSYSLTDKKDTGLRAQSGLGYPVSWLSDSVLTYRVKTDQETADYAISVDGGEPVKIRDVTNSGGVDRWYYY